jgi:hypothetical protein
VPHRSLELHLVKPRKILVRLKYRDEGLRVHFVGAIRALDVGSTELSEALRVEAVRAELRGLPSILIPDRELPFARRQFDDVAAQIQRAIALLIKRLRLRNVRDVGLCRRAGRSETEYIQWGARR